ncbi:hypothetical protein LCGC14_2926870, partial [marine sediment metagenome]
VRVTKDETGEFLRCTGEVFRLDGDEDAPIGVAFGKADNTVLINSKGEEEWGMWFARNELRYSPGSLLSPICPVPPENRLSKTMPLTQENINRIF